MAKPDLTDIALFAAVAEERSFRRAARRRGGSASALSAAVRRLETAIGATLLNRTTRSVSLTDAGREFLHRVTPALAEIGTAIGRAGELARTPTGVLRLNVPTIVARRILPAIVPRFLSAHPGIRMEVMAEDNFIDVLAAGFDAGVRYDERLARDVIAIPIGPRRQRFALGAARSYLAKRGTPRHPRELVGHQLISHRFPHAGPYAWELEKNGRTVKIRPEGPLIASTTELGLAAARAGLGIVCGFEEDLAEAMKRGELESVLADWWPEFPGPSLYFPRGRHITAPLRAFVDFLKMERRKAARDS